MQDDKDVSVLGDVGRSLLLVGPQKAVRGLAETGASIVDFFTDGNLTRDVQEHFDRVAFEKPKTQAGEIASFIGQFGIPGLGAAGVLTKQGKVKQALGFGIVDGAVSTDDTVTLLDTFLDSESDEQRLARLDGSEAAAKRLADKLNVAAEASTFVFGLPYVLKGGKEVAKGSLDVVTPAVSAMAKVGLQATKKISGDKLSKDLLNTNRTMYDRIKNQFTFKRDKPTLNVAKAMGAKTATVLALQEGVDDAFKNITSTVNKISDTTMSQTQKLQLARDIENYMFPRIRVDFQNPSLSQSEARKQARALQKKAEKNIVSLEQTNGMYKGIEITDDLKISKLLQDNRALFDELSEQVLARSDESSTEFMNLFIKDEVREAIQENAGLYGTRIYRAFLNKGYQMDDSFRKQAVEEIQKVFGVTSQKANLALNKLINGGAKNKDSTGTESVQMFIDGLQTQKSILKNRTLDSLPKVRQALGEVSGYLEKTPEQALNNTALVASTTANRLASLLAKAKVYDDIAKLDELSPKTGDSKFLRDANSFADITSVTREGNVNRIVDFTADNKPIAFKQFNEEHGALNGKFIREDLFDAITKAASDFEANNPGILLRLYSPLLSIKAATQYGKTVLSPGAQIRNFTSIPFFATLNGNVGSTGRFVDAVSTTFSGFIDPKTRNIKKEILKELREEGLIQAGGGGRLSEIRDLANLSIERSYFGDKISALGTSVGNIPGIKQTDKFLQKAYSMTDNTARVFNYMGEKQRLLQALRNNPNDFVPVESVKSITKYADLIELNSFGKPVIKPSDIINKFGGDELSMFARAEAGEISQQTVQNYQRTMGFVDIIKQLPVGNFAAFPAEIFRNTTNAVQRSIRELASDNKEIQEIGMRRLAGASFTIGGTGFALTKGLSALTGVAQEKIDAYKRSYAMPWDKTATLIPIASDENGNPTELFNFSYMNPYDYLTRPVNRVFLEVAEGNRNEEELSKILYDSSIGAISELTSSFAEPAFSLQAITDSYYGRTPLGRRIWRESDDQGTRLQKSLIYVLDQTLPSITPFNLNSDLGEDIGFSVRAKDFPRAVFGLTNLQGETKGVKNKRGQELDVADTMVQAFSGFKVIKPQIDRTLLFRGYEANREIRDASNAFNSYLRQFDQKEAQNYLNAYLNANEDRFRSLRDLYLAIDDARELGLSEREIELQLKKAKVANYKDVMRNKFRPIPLDNQRLRESPAPISTFLPLNILENQLRDQDLEGKFIDPRANQPGSVGSQILRQQELDKLVGGT